jgi:hypothetical protein
MEIASKFRRNSSTNFDEAKGESMLNFENNAEFSKTEEAF